MTCNYNFYSASQITAMKRNCVETWSISCSSFHSWTTACCASCAASWPAWRRFSRRVGTSGRWPPSLDQTSSSKITIQGYLIITMNDHCNLSAVRYCEQEHLFPCNKYLLKKLLMSMSSCFLSFASSFACLFLHLLVWCRSAFHFINSNVQYKIITLIWLQIFTGNKII